MNKNIVIIPTYNESRNIKKIINIINGLDIDLDILVVDGQSSDETYAIVKKMQIRMTNLNTILQKSKMGLGSAYKDGFKWAIERHYEKIIQIDADLSHNPNSIPDLISVSNNYDLVIGSRYIKGVNVVNWPMSRLLLSYFANIYVKILTGLNVNDSTSGYKCINRRVIESINFNKVKSQGYSFQIEVNFLAWIKNFTIKETPIIFHDRTVGESKMSRAIIFEAMFLVPRLALKRLFRLW